MISAHELIMRHYHSNISISSDYTRLCLWLCLQQYIQHVWCLCICIPLHNPLQREVAEAVCQASLAELHVLLTGRAREQHGGRGGVLPPTPWVCPAHWEKGPGVHRRGDEGERDTDRDMEGEKCEYLQNGTYVWGTGQLMRKLGERLLKNSEKQNSCLSLTHTHMHIQYMIYIERECNDKGVLGVEETRFAYTQHTCLTDA